MVLMSRRLCKSSTLLLEQFQHSTVLLDEDLAHLVKSLDGCPVLSIRFSTKHKRQ